MSVLSGCMGSNTPTANGTNLDNPKATMISDEEAFGMNKIKNLPIGFEYVGNILLSKGDIKNNYKAENVSGILGGSKGLYKGSNNSDFYLDIIKFENIADTNDFILTYKFSFTPLNKNFRFVEDPFNGHSAVRITDYVIDSGKSVPRYTYIWNNENYVLVVSGSTVNCSLGQAAGRNNRVLKRI